MEQNLHTCSDEEIIKFILEKKDPEFFGLIYDRYAKKVFNKALSFVKNEVEAEDITHDIFLKIFIGLKSFKFNSRFSTWLYSITYNFCVDYVNKRSRELAYLEEFSLNSEEYDEEHDRSEIEILRIKYSCLKDLLDKIAPEERMILLLKYQDELSISEIEKVLGLKTSAIKMRLKRARDKVLYIYKDKYAHNII